LKPLGKKPAHVVFGIAEFLFEIIGGKPVHAILGIDE